MQRRVLRLVLGVVYAFLAVLAVGGLVADGPAAPGPALVLTAALVAGVALGGLALLAVEPWVDGHPRDPVPGVAPSGVPALCWPRSPAATVVRGLFALALGLWLGAFAVVEHAGGHDGWAVLLALCAVAALGGFAAVATGRVRPGGLWLTRLGVEYRKDALSWAVPWTALQRVLADRGSAAPAAPVLVRTEPVVLVLADDAGVGVQRTLRRLRDDQRPLADHHLAVDCFGVAGGRELIVETLEHYLLFPELRPHLGDARSVPRGPR